MENAQTENSAAGGASALTDVLERMRARADNAYCDYIGQLRRDECLGWEIKVERGKFGEVEMKAHCAAAEKLGRHRALHEAANMLAEVLRSNALGQATWRGCLRQVAWTGVLCHTAEG